MPDIFELRKKALEAKSQGSQPNPENQGQQDHSQVVDQYMPPIQEEQEKKQEDLSVPGQLQGDPQDQKSVRDNLRAQHHFGMGDAREGADLEEDPDSWSPEYTMKPWLQEGTESMIRGFGKHVVKGTGDMIQVGAAFAGIGSMEKGNWLSRGLQEAGEDIADNYKQFIPEELQAENLTLKDWMNPKFWSIHAAEYIPQLAEFILLSKGGAWAARKTAEAGAKQVLKRGSKEMLENTTKIANGSQVFGTGKGLTGALLTNKGLTSGASGIVSAMGGGVAGNLLSGALNAADVVNTYKDLEGPNGEKLYDEEDLRQLAASTMRNNATWMIVDMASYGMTYGGGWRKAASMNPLRKGGKLFTKAQQTKVGSKMFQYDVAPAISKLGKWTGQAGFEGIEETFQETFEEWAKKKAIAELEGDPNTDLIDKGFWDFYTSKENDATRTIAGALGMLGGAAFNVQTLIDKKADEHYKLLNRTEMFKTIVDKQGTEEEQIYLDLHAIDQISDIVADDESGGEATYNAFMEKFIQNGNITEDQKGRFDEMFKSFQEVKQEADKLNIKGKKALMTNKSREIHADNMIAQYKERADLRIAKLKGILSGNFQKQKRKEIIDEIRREEELFQKRLSGLAQQRAAAIQNQENLLLGKKATPLTSEIRVDEYGNNIYVGGLKESDFKEYTKEGEKEASAGKKKFRFPSFKLGTRSRELYDKAKSVVMKSPEEDSKNDEEVKEDSQETPETEVDANLSQDEANDIGEKYNVNVTVDQDGNYEVTEKDGAPDKEFKRNKKRAEEEIASVLSQRQDEANEKSKGRKTKQEAERDAEQLMDELLIDDNEERVEDPEYKRFVKDPNDVDEETITNIAKDIMGEGTLTNRQEDIRGKHEQRVKEKIASIMLGTNEIQNVSDENSVVENDEDPNEADPDSIPDEDIDENENDYVNRKASGKKNKKSEKTVTLAQEAREKEEEVVKKWKPDKNRKPKDYDLDAREMDNLEARQIVDMNKGNALAERNFFNKLRNQKIRGTEHISENELDNYLNSFSVYNRFGPTEVNRMAVVNHQLKNMFPTLSKGEDPVQVIAVKNLYDAIGSKGLGSAVGMTIFIDEKAWEQDWVFMHELSHIYRKIAGWGDPVVKDIINVALEDKAFVKKIKEKYWDYTIYDVKLSNGEVITMKLDEIYNHFLSQGVAEQDLEVELAAQIKDDVISTIPIRQQPYILEELFAGALQGPLANTNDKLFHPKEMARQEAVKKFWGLLRKKGEVIEQNGGIEKMLNVLAKDQAQKKKNDPKYKGSAKDLLMDVFKAAKEGIKLDGVTLDARVKKQDMELKKELNNITLRMANANIKDPTVLDNTSDEELIEQYEENAENMGSAFFGDDFQKKAKGATKILKRFGIIQNKALRKKFLRENKGKTTNWKNQKMFDRFLFESFMYNLARENNDPRMFIREIENSSIEEVQDFNDYLDSVYGEEKLQLLSGIHFVFSNSAHIGGMRHVMNSDGKYSMESSLSQKEKNQADTILGELDSARVSGSPRWVGFREAVNRIKTKQEDANDYITVIKALTDTRFNLTKVMEQGVLNYDGRQIPIDIVLSAFIQKGGLDWKGTSAISAWNARPLVESLLQTNRKFTPYSTIVNSEGNMEQARITNNHLTNEVDNMINFLRGDENGKPTLAEFTDRYAHLGSGDRMKIGDAPIRSGKMKDIYKFISPNGSKRIPSKKKIYEAFPEIPTGQIDQVHQYLTKGKKGKRPSEADFLQQYKGKIQEWKENRAYSENQFLKSIYENFQKGIMPTVTQYHGLQDTSNRKATSYQSSTAMEQSLEDFLTFVDTSTNSRGQRNRNYLGNLGVFADSPRKFFMNMNRIKFEDVFEKKGNGNYGFHRNGKILNSAFAVAQKIFPEEAEVIKENGKIVKKGTLSSKAEFQKSIRESIEGYVKFLNDNSEALSKIDKMGPLLRKDGKLNYQGKIYVAEHVINSVIHGVNVAEVFVPGVQGQENVAKRFKSQSSPVFSVKNPNFKTEFLFFADELVDGSESGTDSGAYILEEDALKLQKLGKGVFDMNHGFKILNSHIEKTNPNFKGHSAYLKSYVTPIKEGHPMYAALKARKDKYNEYHKKKYGAKPSEYLADGSANHVVIAMPQSADKNNFYRTPFIKDGQHTEQGKVMTPTYLSQTHDHIHAEQDKLYYDENGDFIGLESYNFGPQQVMDKVVKQTNFPVQLMNSVLVNVAKSGKLELAEEIQRLITMQKDEALNEIIQNIQDGNINKYKDFIMEHINEDDMDQAQLLLLKDGGSIAHPRVNDIAVNQLAKSILRAGNKLATEGTLAHQKPDTGYNLNPKIRKNAKLEGYTKNADGSLIPAGMVLPKHMKDEVRFREEYTIDTKRQILDAAQRGKKTKFTKAEELEALKSLAEKQAKYLAKKETGNESNYPKYVGKVTNEKGVEIGYFVRGETLLATRVPSHGPSSTGVYEAIAYDDGDGNQVMVSGKMNDITGADNDGDALFIQKKGSDKKYAHWNKAFDKLTEHWLSPQMANQVQTLTDFKEDANKAVSAVDEMFGAERGSLLPFTPQARAQDYNNTMVSKRNIGAIFNIHKVANMLAAYEVGVSKPIKIGSKNFSKFEDFGDGNTSRNHKSGMVANIILDNVKHGYADKIGLDEHNMSQAALMVNMGVSLTDVALILNSKAAKLWSEKNRNNSSLFHKSKKASDILDEVYKELKITKPESKPKSFNVDPKKANDPEHQENILELLGYLSEMNGDLQKVIGIMSGHNKIHVNPFVLEKQLGDYEAVLKGKEDQALLFNQGFRNNPDMKQYEKVARRVLTHTQNMSPIYRPGTKRVLEVLDEKIGNLNTRELETLSKDLKKFISSRLLSLNNVDKQYVEELLSTDPKSEDSIYAKMRDYIAKLKSDESDMENPTKSISAYENSLLFNKALNLNLYGSSPYISTNPSFTNESFNQEERARVMEEFEELPADLKKDLLIYDLVTHGWEGNLSLSSIFEKETNDVLNMAANLSQMDKDKEGISKAVLKKLERTIALKHSKSKNNPFRKVYLGKTTLKNGYSKPTDVTNRKKAIDKVVNDKSIMDEYQANLKPMYINVRSGNQSALYEIPRLTTEELNEYKAANSRTKRDVLNSLVKRKMFMVNDNLSFNPEIDIATINDANLGNPYSPRTNYKPKVNMDGLTYATISYEGLRPSKNVVLDAREDFDIPLFSKKQALTQDQYEQAMEFNSRVSQVVRDGMYDKYRKEKRTANALARKELKGLQKRSKEELLDMYQKYGEKDVYAYSVILTPIVKELANRLSTEQMALWKKNGVKGKGFDGQDVSKLQAQFMTGSTIPSNHPAAQALVRMIEKEYKVFTSEKKKYMAELNQVTDALYKDRLGYGIKSRLKHIYSRIKMAVGITNELSPYERLYGNLVIREPIRDDEGSLTYDFRLKPKEEIEKAFENGEISKAEKDFYDTFRKISAELKPKKMRAKTEKDYIPHTSMGKLESLGARGLLGSMLGAKGIDGIYDVKMYHTINGEKKLVNFRTIEDIFKRDAANKHQKHDINKIIEYKKLKRKAKRLLESGKNEDESPIRASDVDIETALGFGAVNRFAMNRSVKATELPSMDLNKALGDYIHSTLFVNGNDKFQGMERLQGFIDGVLAFNRENNLTNMNTHIQTVWKDYFTRGKRQESFLGKDVDNVIRTLTKLNLFYALGWQANKNTMGLYTIGNILVGKYHNIKDVGGKAWLKGEMRFWGLDGLKDGPEQVVRNFKRNQRIMRNLNFMDINIYDEVDTADRNNSLDKMVSDIALMPMIKSEEWIQRVHMLGLLSDEELALFDGEGNYREGVGKISNDRIIQLEDQVKQSHGRGYQPTDQRAIQMYSWGNMMMQFSKFIPTMFQDRFAKKDVNIYGQEHIGSLRAVSGMVKKVVNDPKGFLEYRSKLKPEERRRLDSGLKGMAMSSIIGFAGAAFAVDAASELYWDANYYFNHEKLSGKVIPPAIQSTNNLVSSLF